MTGPAWITSAVIAGMMAALASNRLSADLVMLAALLVLLVAGVVDPAAAFAGFANEGVLTVAFLYVVVAGLRQSGLVARAAATLLGRPTTAFDAQLRVVAPVTALSAFVNNTPLVAVYLPLVSSLARRSGVAPSQLFLPLSYAAILGGVCTLIGTSTNVVVNGLLLDHNRLAGGTLTPFGMFTLSPVGVPVAVCGVAYMLLAGRRLLPARLAVPAADDARRDYMVALRVESGAAVIGRSLEAAGLRHLSGLFLAHIERHGGVLRAVGPDETLQADDVLVFVGVRTSVVELYQIQGLVPAAWDGGAGGRQDHRLIEAVIATSSPMVGQTIRDGAFRTKYGGVIVAVHRHGERLAGKLGDIRLRAGDAILIDAPPGFVGRHQHASAFHLISGPEDAHVLRHDRAWIAAVVFLGFVVLSAAGWLPTLAAAMLAAGAMLACGCTDLTVARQTVDWPVLAVIAAGVGIGNAVQASGLAEVVSQAMLSVTSGGGPAALLTGVYALTWLLTSVLSNTAAAVLVFPVALHAAASAGLAFEPLAIAIAIAASCEFTTPIGYQTNLMVQGPGSYRLSDYMRFGAPLTLLCGAVTIAILATFYY